MNIAIFGGSFDPVHLGHEKIVKNALDMLDIDKLIIIPTYISPFKDSFCASPSLRISWLKKVFDYDEKLIIDEYEINEQKPTPSIQTVRYLIKKYNPNKTYFIIGADHVQTLPKWHEYDVLKTLVEFVVADRLDIFIPDEFKHIKMKVDISSSIIRNELKIDKVNDKIKDEVINFYQGLKC